MGDLAHSVLTVVTHDRPPAGWERLPLLVRMAIGAGCFLLFAAAVYVLASVAVRLASLVIALAAALLIAALLGGLPDRARVA